MFACLSLTTRTYCDASRTAVRAHRVVTCRDVCFNVSFSAAVAVLLALIPGTAQASCGKGYVVIPPGHAGAVVEAIVTKHRQAYAEQTKPSRTPAPACSGPGCHDNAPAPYEAPLVRTKIKTKIDATHGIVEDLRDREVAVFVRDPDEAIYPFEVAPPPTPPPNPSLGSLTI